MSDCLETDSVFLPLELERLIDSICDQFEQSLKRGEQPDVLGFVENVAPLAQAHLRTELMLLISDYDGRVHASERSAKGAESLDFSTAKSRVGDLPTEREPADEIAAEFQKALERGEQISVEGVLGSEHLATPCSLLRRLLDVEMAFRAGRGQSPELSEYRFRFPQHWRLVKFLYFQHFVPRQLGAFPIERVLGEGGFGKVYLATDPKLQRKVAIKVFRRDPATAVPRGSLLFEAQAAARLQHEGIVTVFAVLEDEDQDEFIVLDYVCGTSLEHVLGSERPTHEDSVRIMIGVARALQHAHDHKLVHRDLKPSNILLDQDRNPRVSDFGLALCMTNLRDVREIAGTLPYMAPEQVRGETHLIDGRTDVWAMGVILYRMLTGALPFQNDRRAAVLDSISTGEPTPIAAYDPVIPAELVRIVGRCLAKRMSERYATADEMAEDLVAFLANDQHDHPGSKQGRVGDGVIAPKGLCSFDASDREAFLNLVPGPRDRHGVPESVRFWERHLRAQSADETFRVGLIYGPSGCGKTSLLRAGVLPRLPSHVRRIVVEASHDDTEAQLLKSLRQHFPDLASDGDLTAIVGELREGGSLPPGHKLVIVIDQFEQWLHAWRNEPPSVLVQTLRQCDGARVQALLSVRDDFWMLAARFFQQLETGIFEGHNAASVDLFDRDHARKVLTAFGRACGRVAMHDGPTSEQRSFIDSAINDLSEDGRVIPVRLGIFTELVKTRPWNADTLAETGGLKGLGVTFLAQTFDDRRALPAHRAIRKPARLMLERLLPPVGTNLRGHSVIDHELRVASGLSDAEAFSDVLRCLDRELHLITPATAIEEADATGLPSPEPYQATHNYQLTHDFLVPAVREWLNQDRRATARGRAQLRLAEYASSYAARPSAQQLPSWPQWLSMLSLTSRHKWSAAERKMMCVASRRHSRLAFLWGALGLALSGLVYYRTNAARTDELVQALASSDSRDLPRAVDRLDAYRWWAAPRLEAMLSDSSQTADRRARLLLGASTVLENDAHTQELVDRFLTVDTPLALAIVSVLASRGEPESMASRMAAMVGDRRISSDQRLRAAVVLARGGPRNDDLLDSVSAEMGPILLRTIAENPRYIDMWAEAFQSSSRWIEPSLQQSFLNSEVRVEERLVAANLLVRYQHNDLHQLTELALESTPKQFEVLAQELKGRLSPIRDDIEIIAATAPPADMAEDQKDHLARRQANALLLLREAGDAARLWPALKHQPDPRLRAFLINHFQQLPGASGDWMSQLRSEPDIGIRQALILMLGCQRIGDATQVDAEVLKLLVESHCDDPDAGVHGATIWSLKQLGFDHELAQATKRLATLGIRKGFGWYVTPSELTMILVRAPGTVQLGSPETEPGRDASNEQLDPFDVTWNFAISATEVTQAQFRSICPEHTACQNDHTPQPECPANGVTWLEAIQYCRRLSEYDGVPEGEMVVPVIKLPIPNRGTYADFRTHSGYRLPIEAEWEFVCRAGTATPRHFGSATDLLPSYSCYIDNSLGLTLPVASLLPNQWGAFDMLGNVSEWCYNAEPDTKGLFRAPGYAYSFRYMVRGNDFMSPGRTLRTANRRDEAPGARQAKLGFRIAHTVTPSEDNGSPDPLPQP